MQNDKKLVNSIMYDNEYTYVSERNGHAIFSVKSYLPRFYAQQNYKHSIIVQVRHTRLRSNLKNKHASILLSFKHLEL